MNKIVTIHDWQNEGKDITIEDFENVKKIVCTVLTGDEVLNVHYENNIVVTFDSSEDRNTDYNDGMVVIPLDRLDEFSSIANSYEMLDRFSNEEETK